MAKIRGKKILVGFLVFSVFGIGIAGVGTWYIVNQTNNLKREFADYVVAYPDDVAIVAYTFDENGDPIEDEYSLFHNADQPFVLASTVKLAVLAAYAEAVASGRLDPNEQISVKEWEKYYLPMTDGGAHILGLKSMGLEVDELGFALDQTATVPLDNVARIMIHYSGNAATDYLLMRIGAEEMASVMAEAGLENSTPVRPLLGTVLAMFNHENTQPTIAQLQSLSNDISEGNTDYMDRLMERYLNDQAWRNAQIEFMTPDNITASIGEQNMLDYQAAASQLFPKGTAREYAQLMAQIARGKLISAEASEIMQQHLESVPSDWPLYLIYYDRFGAKDGVTPGVLTLASYTVPKRGELAGQYRVVVLLANQMPFEQWSNQLQLEGHYLLQTDLAQASGVFSDVYNLE
ncbi:hypothetical protein MNBD_CHLOROFLEXI01-410 [hydrothermal vent metagenome]|uniref:Beta-lactamase class A catalytic domain-containing protein n=1 Tax=hydrothermal vent metagenome TaxID=652676 RepID=A0A3B0VH02_9ZZZZ